PTTTGPGTGTNLTGPTPPSPLSPLPPRATHQSPESAKKRAGTRAPVDPQEGPLRGPASTDYQQQGCTGIHHRAVFHLPRLSFDV
ncbi:hypothetical protein Prudu_012794, partial [Prunus dulcis]